ncbi:glycolate oxidase subunit GlcE [Methylolobus aquaticus]
MNATSGGIAALPDADCESALQDGVRDALARRQPLRIVGGGSKGFLARSAEGEALCVADHRGILAYEPTELVVTARGGTPLAELEEVLAEGGQMLAFEPPHFGLSATIGGAIACGLSGPRRPFSGSARDFVLGVKLLNGRAETLRFGGTVMKNVAGFDVSRLMVGAYGTLGVLLEVSLKVLPRPRCELSLSFEMNPSSALQAMQSWASGSWPISGLAYDGRLRVRLSGDEVAVQAARRRLGGEPADCEADYWRALREQDLPFFAGAADLWRLSVPPAGRLAPLPGEWLYDWGGAQRWLRTSAPDAEVFAAAASCGGHAMLFRTPMASAARFQPLEPRLMDLHRSLKAAFDPDGLFNPGRMYEGL